MSINPSSPEYLYAEKPTLDQLQMMGWQYLEGDWHNPTITERENFKQVLLLQRLRKAIKNINRDENDQPWLEDDQIETAINTLERAVTSQNLIEANQIITELLIKGTNIEDNNQKNHPIHYIDYQNIKRNDFLAINQFRVNSPWATSNKSFAVPDIVLFVNGIPLVVIECKSPNLTNPLSDGINDLIQYSNQGDSNNLKAVEKLFHYKYLCKINYILSPKIVKNFFEVIS
jgi:type I restriction enzyme R subunit